jgi:hypothetical protein
MNEYYNGPSNPGLSELEIRSLANRALLHGQIRDVDYPDEQLKDRPQPHTYALSLDPSVLHDYYANQPLEQLELPVSVAIEYEEARIIEAGQPIVEPAVYVVIASTLTMDGQPVYKDTTYHLPLNPHEPAEAVEVYSDAKGRLTGEFSNITDALQAMMSEARPLTDDDIRLLRLII